MREDRDGACDLLDPAEWPGCPDVPNVVFWRGGSLVRRRADDHVGDEHDHPGVLRDRFRQSRMVVFSTGNVYPLVPASGPASTEDDPPSPVGEYAASCVGRERVFESSRDGAPRGDRPAELRDRPPLRQLVDIATRVKKQQPVSVEMGYVNVIWQGDANRIAIECLPHTSSPPFVVNLTGDQHHSVRAIAEWFGERFGRPSPIRRGRAPGRAPEQRRQDAIDFLGARGVAVAPARAGRCLGGPGRRAARETDQVRGARWPLLTLRSPAFDVHACAGLAIPAHPLALTAARRLDERRQRALTRYYIEAGAGGIAVGVHTTQFAIRDPELGLYAAGPRPGGRGQRALGAERPGNVRYDRRRLSARRRRPVARRSAAPLGYDAGLLSLGGCGDSENEAMLDTVGQWPRSSRCSASISSPPWAGARSPTASGGVPRD